MFTERMCSIHPWIRRQLPGAARVDCDYTLQDVFRSTKTQSLRSFPGINPPYFPKSCEISVMNGLKYRGDERVLIPPDVQYCVMRVLRGAPYASCYSTNRQHYLPLQVIPAGPQTGAGPPEKIRAIKYVTSPMLIDPLPSASPSSQHPGGKPPPKMYVIR